MSFTEETCEGCKYANWGRKAVDAYCVHPDHFSTEVKEEDGVTAKTKAVWGWERCDLFSSSLECRKVRALEKISDCVVVHQQPGGALPFFVKISE